MFGQRLREARRARGLSARALGECLTPKVTRSAVSHWEAGRNLPKTEILFDLARVLEVSVEWLRGDSAELRRDLLRQVAAAFEEYLQRESLAFEPVDYARTLLAIYDWAEDQSRAQSGAFDLDITQIAAFLHLARPQPRR